MTRLYYIFGMLLLSSGVFGQIHVSEVLTLNEVSDHKTIEYIESRSVLDSGATGNYFSAKGVRLLQGFKVAKGANFRAKIDEFPNSINNLLLSPNPTYDNFVAEFEVFKSSNVRINLYNSTGFKVLELMPSVLLESGLYKKGFSTSDLPFGIYLVRLETSEETITRKLVKRDK
ncbi:MAG: T9SS type A sorting domain-containing protein [Cytophagales bacterium]|nr:T9SS type A sorting domain-containing protein [Cytophagales bacterium]